MQLTVLWELSDLGQVLKKLLSETGTNWVVIIYIMLCGLKMHTNFFLCPFQPIASKCPEPKSGKSVLLKCSHKLSGFQKYSNIFNSSVCIFKICTFHFTILFCYCYTSIFKIDFNSSGQCSLVG